MVDFSSLSGHCVCVCVTAVHNLDVYRSDIHNLDLVFWKNRYFLKEKFTAKIKPVFQEKILLEKSSLQGNFQFPLEELD